MGTPLHSKVDSKFGLSIAAIALAFSCGYGPAASAQLIKTVTDTAPKAVPVSAPVAASAMVKPVDPQPSHTTPLTIFVDHKTIKTTTSATTVAAALADAKISVGQHDIVFPKADTVLAPDAPVRVRVRRVVTWTQSICSRIAPRIISHPSASLMKNTSHVESAGRAGLRQTTIRFTSIDGERSHSRVIATHVISPSRPRIVARGTALPKREEISQRIGAFAQSTLARTGIFTHAAMAMIATAYTAFCDTCSGTGRGATGMLVHHGVVAVDPRVIPLGSHLFIPGYGPAVAGDTGGAIIGHRIDLAFNSYDDAIRFGRRPITVYVLP